MLKKDQRLTADEFDTVYQKGERIDNRFGHLRVLQPKTGKKLACTVSSSAVKKSVKRTRIRRRGYAAAEKHFAKFPKNTWGIWLLTPEVLTVEFSRLSDSFQVTVNELQTDK